MGRGGGRGIPTTTTTTTTTWKSDDNNDTGPGGGGGGDSLYSSPSGSKIAQFVKSSVDPPPPTTALNQMDWKSYLLRPPQAATTTTTVILRMGAKHQSGVGSQLLNLMAIKIYMEDILSSSHRHHTLNFVVDTTPYYIQYYHDDQPNNNNNNTDLGFLGGWFTTTFPLIQNQYDLQQISQIIPHYSNSSSNHNSNNAGSLLPTKDWEDWLWSQQQQEQEAEASQSQSRAIIMSNPDLKFVRRFFHPKYGATGYALYQRFATEACANFRFNDYSQRLIQQIKTLYEIPTTTTTTTHHHDNDDDNPTTTTPMTTTVAFHVRRGDKVKQQRQSTTSRKRHSSRGESKLFHGMEYVQKLVDVLQQQQQQQQEQEGSPPPSSPTTGMAASKIEHCFVATDDYVAVDEIRRALQHYKIECRLHFLVQPHQRGHVTDGNHRFDEILQFFTELSILIESTYFVGTFNSNVGCLVALLRSCAAGSNSGNHGITSRNPTKKSPQHSYHSYGVDREDWWFR